MLGASGAAQVDRELLERRRHAQRLLGQLALGLALPALQTGACK
jgi:hypothetical protein